MKMATAKGRYLSRLQADAAGRKDGATTPWAIELFAATDDTESVREAERIEQVVFEASFDCDQQQWEEEFRPYDDRSVWVTIRHHDRMVGAFRGVVGPPDQLKIASDLQRFWGVSIGEAMRRHGLPSDLAVVEAATLSVLPEYRTLDGWWPVKALTGAFVHFAVDSGSTHVVQLTEPTVERVLRVMMGLHFERWADLEPVDFQGLMHPAISDVATYRKSVDIRDDEHRRLVRDRATDGRGGTSLPPLDLTPTSPLSLHRRLQGAFAAKTTAETDSREPSANVH